MNDRPIRQPKRKTLSPQRKKSLSLEKDRRNDYGENDKGARKTIPHFKRVGIRSARHSDRINISQDAESADAKLELNLRKRKRKSPDAPLGNIVAAKLKERGFLEETADQEAQGRRRYFSRTPK